MTLVAIVLGMNEGHIMGQAVLGTQKESHMVADTDSSNPKGSFPTEANRKIWQKIRNSCPSSGWAAATQRTYSLDVAMIGQIILQARKNTQLGTLIGGFQ